MLKHERDYNIFEDFESWRIIAYQADKEHNENENSYFCSNIKYNSKNDEQLKYICRMFVTLFEVAMRNCNTSRTNIKDTKYPELLNYWLNFKLTGETYEKTNIDNLFGYIRSNCDTFKARDILNNKIHYMENQFFYNIHILYKLYENYDKLKENKHEYYDKFLKEMKYHYNYGLEKCFFYGDIEFCKALKTYRDDYVKTEASEKKYCHENQCQTLPELILESSSHKELLKNAKLGKELVGVSFIPLLNGPSEDHSGKYSDLKYLIFLQYNLRIEKDNDEKNCVMIKILHQYFQYCSENKDNQKLASFMKEFIDEYYKKHEEKYKKIFEECKGEGTSNKYCNLYNTCKKEFETDLSLIKDNPDSYLVHQNKNINKSSADTSSIANTLSMFLDFAANSKYSTTIVSIMISFFLCFFFLYKVLNNYI